MMSGTCSSRGNIINAYKSLVETSERKYRLKLYALIVGQYYNWFLREKMREFGMDSTGSVAVCHKKCNKLSARNFSAAE
jgi:hypothetical protein